MTMRTALLALLGISLLLPAGTANAQGDEDTVLSGSGIRYPGGFDANTVGEVRGKASGFFRPERGPVRFRLDSGKEIYTVLAGPGWFWNDLDIEVPDGTEVRVRGSKSLGGDGRLYIVAQEMEIPGAGRRVAFRDEDGFPMWAGGRTGVGGIHVFINGAVGGLMTTHPRVTVTDPYLKREFKEPSHDKSRA
ncbi:MAG: hypothetical protein ACM3NF_05955, partial [Gemmatimonadota bacterium]